MTVPKIIRNIDAADMMIRKREPFQTRARRTPYGDFVSMSGHIYNDATEWPIVVLGRERDRHDKVIPGGGIDTRTLSYGHLPMAYRDSMERADYVVYSYDTPIAWHTDRPHDLRPDLIESWLDGTGDGVWVMPEVKYTVTTTKHQTDVRCALGGLVTGWWANNGGNRLPELPYVQVALPNAPAKVEGVGCERYAY